MKSIEITYTERIKKLKADAAAIRKKLTSAEWKTLQKYFTYMEDNGYRGPG